ncbi:hypothetical protein OBBRIDRAFT_840266, partial [Obba rivulosa]
MAARSTARTPYAATTPDRTVFGDDIPLAALDRPRTPPTPSPSPPPLPLRLETIHEVPEPGVHPPRHYLDHDPNPVAAAAGARARWRRLRARSGAFVVDNTGLLLIAASQAFGSLMSVAVKQLSTWDPPVPPLEV